MTEPTIDYGFKKRGLNSYGQYALMYADITNGTYVPQEFTRALQGIIWQDSLDPQRVGLLGVERVLMSASAERASSVTISNFSPNRVELERIMRTPPRTGHSD